MKNKNLRKAALSAFLMLVVAVVSLTGVTYAWFTSGNDATVSDINVSVDSAEGGLLISTDNKSWSTSLSFTEDGTKTLTPVSTVGTLDGTTGDIIFFNAKLAGDTSKITSIEQATDANKTYIKKDIYFNNYTGAAKEITLKLDLPAVTNDTNGNAPSNTQLASRVAIVFRGNIDAADYTANVTDFTALDNGGVVKIYEPNSTSHTLMGKIDAGKAGITALDGKYNYWGIQAAPVVSTTEVNRFGVNVPNDKEGEGAVAVLKTVETTDPGENGAVAFTIGEKSFSKISIYIWIEGQDYDCQNDVAATTFKLGMSFAAPAQAAEQN